VAPFVFSAGAVHDPLDGGITMLRWALAFLVLALIAAFLGFGGIAAASAGIAKTLFFLFLLIFAVTLILGLMAGNRMTSS
jgi:uncharacterized membrane protein YtjA (UPF0391 family)